MQKSRETGAAPPSWMPAERSLVCSTAPSAYLFLGIRELDEQPLSEVPARECQANNVLERQPLEFSTSMMAHGEEQRNIILAASQTKSLRSTRTPPLPQPYRPVPSSSPASMSFLNQ